MPYVLTVGSSVQCTHQGKVTLKGSQTKLTVDGQAVLVDGDLDNATIAGCQVKVSNSTQPCKTVTGVLGGKSTTLAVGGKAVLLDTAAGTTDGLPPPPQLPEWNVASAGQTKLQAD
jgi:hypothetical protein